MTLLTALCIACASNGDPSESGDVDAEPNGGYLATPPCRACLDEVCAVQLRACDSDATCRELRLCRAACTTHECDQACTASVAPDAPATSFMASLSECAKHNCGAMCGAAPACPEDVAACVERFDQTYSLAECADYRDCACGICPDVLAGCFEDENCRAVLGCVIPSGCESMACLSSSCTTSMGGLSGVWTSATIYMLECVHYGCAPCSRGDAVP